MVDYGCAQIDQVPCKLKYLSMKHYWTSAEDLLIVTIRVMLLVYLSKCLLPYHNYFFVFRMASHPDWGRSGWGLEVSGLRSRVQLSPINCSTFWIEASRKQPHQVFHYSFLCASKIIISLFLFSFLLSFFLSFFLSFSRK